MAGQPVEHDLGPDGQTVIAVAPAVKALGGRLVVNRELGTVDVYRTPKMDQPAAANLVPP